MQIPHFVWITIGPKGSGKSLMIRETIDHFDRLVAFDPHEEYFHGTLIESTDDALEFLDWNRDRNFRVIFRDIGQEDLELAEQLSMLEDLRNAVVVLEETSVLLDDKESRKAFKRFLRHGRHWNVSLVLVAHRPTDIIRMATSMADVIVMFHSHEPIDLEWVRKTRSEEEAEQVRALSQKDHEWMYLRQDHPQLVKLIDGLSTEVHGAPGPGGDDGDVGSDEGDPPGGDEADKPAEPAGSAAGTREQPSAGDTPSDPGDGDASSSA